MSKDTKLIEPKVQWKEISKPDVSMLRQFMREGAWVYVCGKDIEQITDQQIEKRYRQFLKHEL